MRNSIDEKTHASRGFRDRSFDLSSFRRGIDAGSLVAVWAHGFAEWGLCLPSVTTVCAGYFSFVHRLTFPHDLDGIDYDSVSLFGDDHLVTDLHVGYIESLVEIDVGSVSHCADPAVYPVWLKFLRCACELRCLRVVLPRYEAVYIFVLKVFQN